MRPPRIIILVAFFVTSVFLTFLSLRSSHQHHTIASDSATTPPAGIQAFFSFRAPFSIFPPNAIITLTHENSTAFLARPAAFGPLLPADGLKGQVWIGSGFGDDMLRHGAVAAGAEGELGCSDVPGWVDTSTKPDAAATSERIQSDAKPATAANKSRNHKRGSDVDGEDGALDDSSAQGDAKPPADDGTDDYLHHPLPSSSVSKSNDIQSADSKNKHADIQSIQEGAEIAGKIVLLSRGGCGFLEKVKWAQRRGAIALIVGDDTKGGPLIQMFARGDTSNVTIPSIFTSRTTAHLLSSLMGPGSFIEDTIDENGKTSLKVQHSSKPKKAKKKQDSGPTFTPTVAANKAAMTARPASKKSTKKSSAPVEGNAAVTTRKQGWFSRLIFGSSQADSKSDSSRPPSSGQLDWVIVDDWKDDDGAGTKKVAPKPTQKLDTKKPSQSTTLSAKLASGDDFVIGVQDWRDPDLVGPSVSKDSETVQSITTNGKDKLDVTKAKNTKPQSTKAGKKHIGGALQDISEYVPTLRGGSITPGSGEYGAKTLPSEENSQMKENEQVTTAKGGKSKGLLTTIFGDDEEDVEFLAPDKSSTASAQADGSFEDGAGDDDEYEGLWVTLTPTSGASPFLDTLLVLVVSPLVTLTVVYALLLIRSRIRRRRWRAPKSVVERLPVRTYQTIATPASQSPRLPTPGSSSPTTPLLQHSPPTRPRPRSRTTTGIPEPGDMMRVNSNPLQVPTMPTRSHDHEKNASVSSEWKKYMGKQVECVVCLEEYVDGISRVMSLPCGHEFHVDCITPWLTTRRRTCPICKGDVVRSLARGSPASARFDSYHDDSDEDVQTQAAETVNNSSIAALPISRSTEDLMEGDLEQGIVSPTPRRPRREDRAGSWRSILASSLGSTSRSPRPLQEDRDR